MRRCEDWLTEYMAYQDNSEPPRLYHLWSGIMAISSALQRKSWLSWGNAYIYPNLYVVLVGPPGGRKGSAMRDPKNMLRELGVKLSSDCITPQQLFRELVTSDASAPNPETDGLLYHKSLSIWSEEFSVFIGNQNPDMIVALTDLFDCPDYWVYSTKTKGSDDLSNAFLNVFGAIPPKILQSKLTQDAVGGGLISRIIFVVGYGKEKFVPLPFPSSEELEMYENLLYDLSEISQISGPFRFTEAAIELYRQWYLNPANSAAIDGEQFVGYNERRSLHLRKLCMIMSASHSNDRIIRESHFRKAVATLERTEKEMPNAFFGLGRGFHAQTLSELMLFFQDYREATWQEILDRFKLDVGQDELSKLLQMLETTGRISVERSQTSRKYVASSLDQEDSSSDLLDETIFSKIKET